MLGLDVAIVVEFKELSGRGAEWQRRELGADHQAFCVGMSGRFPSPKG